MSLLIDTCAISELIKPKPSRRVFESFDAASPNALFVSVLTFGEIRKGIAKLDAGRRRVRLTAWLETELPSWFEEHSAGRSGCRRRMGTPHARPEKIPIIDGLLAATALRHRLTVVTRNEPGFAATGAALPNPWKE